MQHLYLSPALRYYEPLPVRSEAPATAEMCFCYDLVEALRPVTIVDVGAGNATAFFAFCQSMRDHDVDGVVFAVDEWPEDQRAPKGEPSYSTGIGHQARQYYRGTTYLLHTDSSSAARQFASQSVDLVRLDPARCEETPADLLSTWISRLKPNGLLLCAGVRDSQIGPAWQRSIAGRRGATLACDRSLGLLTSNSVSAESELLGLVLSADSSDLEGLAKYYEHAALHHRLRQETRPRSAPIRAKGPGGARS
jgi:hypothetical protein